MHEICVFAVERGKVEVIDDVFMRFARQERFDGQAHQSFNVKIYLFASSHLGRLRSATILSLHHHY